MTRTIPTTVRRTLAPVFATLFAPVFVAVVLLAGATPAGAEDLGKKACAQEARRLCPAEMKSLSRKRVESCMIARIDQTSPTCHAAMLRIRAQREARGAMR